jgi:hypothetical protein
MGRATFEGPIIAGNNRFGSLRNVGYADLSQETSIVLTNTTNATAGYGGASGSPPQVAVTNLVSNAGVVATDTAGVGTARYGLAACGYGSDKGIFGYGGIPSSVLSMTNLVSNTGVVATDTTGVGTARYRLAAASYGWDTAIFGYGYSSSSNSALSLTNLVSNTGVVATDTAGVGTARSGLAGAGL